MKSFLSFKDIYGTEVFINIDNIEHLYEHEESRYNAETCRHENRLSVRVVTKGNKCLEISDPDRLVKQKIEELFQVYRI